MKENDYLYCLKEAQEIADNCDGDSKSRLCSSCRGTDYGCENNYSSHPDFGMVSCEGSYCDEAIENAEDELTDEYNYRRGELKMSEAKMNVEIDLSVLEQNIVKMATDRIETQVVDVLTSRIMKSVESNVLEKVNNMVSERVNSITESDIYNVEIKVGNDKVKLFDFMISQLVNKAKQKSIEFEDKIDELIDSVEYESVDGEFSDNEFKVLTIYNENEDGNTNGITIQINGEDNLSLYEGEPEDMTFNRDLNDAFNITDLMEKAYLAGKSGKIMYRATETQK